MKLPINTIVKNISSFFATPDVLSSREEFQEITEYNPGDEIHDINWKKSAQYDTIVKNVYDNDEKIGGAIFIVTSQNIHKGYSSPIKTRIDTIVQHIQKSTETNQRSYIRIFSIDKPPAKKFYNRGKIIVISDFFRDKMHLERFLDGCKIGNVKGVIMPLLVEGTSYTHPLTEKYEYFFWEGEL